MLQPPWAKSSPKRPRTFGQSHGGSAAGGARATTPPPPNPNKNRTNRNRTCHPTGTQADGVPKGRAPTRNRHPDDKTAKEPNRAQKANVAHDCPTRAEPRKRQPGTRTAHATRNPRNLGGSRTAERSERPATTEPGHQEPHDPTNQSAPPIGQGRKFVPQHRRASHATNGRKVNRTRTELDKDRKDALTDDRSRDTLWTKAQVSAPPCDGTRNRPNHGRKRPEADDRNGPERKRPKLAETGPKGHFRNPRTRTQKKAKKRTSHMIGAATGANRGRPRVFHISTWRHKKRQKKPKKV